MSTNCLVTKLNGVVDNSNLEKLGEVGFYVYLPASGTTNIANLYPIVGSGKTITLEFPNNTISSVTGGTKLSDHKCTINAPVSESISNRWIGPVIYDGVSNKAFVRVKSKYDLDTLPVIFSSDYKLVDFSYIHAAYVSLFGTLPDEQEDMFDYNAIKQLAVYSSSTKIRKIISNCKNNSILSSLILSGNTFNGETITTEEIAENNFPLTSLNCNDISYLTGDISYLAKFNFTSFYMFNGPTISGQIEQLALGQIKRGVTTGQILLGYGCGKGDVKFGTVSQINVQNYGPNGDCTLSWAPNASDNSRSDVTYSCPSKSKSNTITIDNTTGEEIQ